MSRDPKPPPEKLLPGRERVLDIVTLVRGIDSQPNQRNDHQNRSPNAATGVAPHRQTRNQPLGMFPFLTGDGGTHFFVPKRAITNRAFARPLQNRRFDSGGRQLLLPMGNDHFALRQLRIFIFIQRPMADAPGVDGGIDRPVANPPGIDAALSETIPSVLSMTRVPLSTA